MYCLINTDVNVCSPLWVCVYERLPPGWAIISSHEYYENLSQKNNLKNERQKIVLRREGETHVRNSWFAIYTNTTFQN